ncbi:hypothetical protein ACP70R_007704 [Stipagrostis hirtigluma subsp. patula]
MAAHELEEHKPEQLEFGELPGAMAPDGAVGVPPCCTRLEALSAGSFNRAAGREEGAGDSGEDAEQRQVSALTAID